MSDSNSEVDLTDRQRRRFEDVRDACADENAPDLTDQQVMDALLDTWNAVDRGLYTEPETGDDEAEEDADAKELDDVYHERNLLACALAQATHAPSGWKPAPDAGDEWATVWIESPMGQLSWHIPRELAKKLAPPRRDVGYDGYSTVEKNDRLASWADEGCWS